AVEVAQNPPPCAHRGASAQPTTTTTASQRSALMIWVRREDLVSTADDASATPSAPLSAAGSSCTAVSMFSTVSFPSPLRQQLRQFRRQLGQLTGTLQHVGLELRDCLGRDSPTAQPHHVHAGYPGRNASTDGEGWQFTGD